MVRYLHLLGPRLLGQESGAGCEQISIKAPEDGSSLFVEKCLSDEKCNSEEVLSCLLRARPVVNCSSQREESDSVEVF